MIVILSALAVGVQVDEFPCAYMYVYSMTVYVCDMFGVLLLVCGGCGNAGKYVCTHAVGNVCMCGTLEWGNQ